MLAQANRLRTAADFRRVLRTGRKRQGALVLCAVRRTAPDAPLRMGVVVTRRVGNAVVRNRVRRRIKAIGFGLAKELVGVDVVVRVSPAAASAAWVTLKDEVEGVVRALAAAEPPRTPTVPAPARRPEKKR